jgi:hypothetical protein
MFKQAQIGVIANGGPKAIPFTTSDLTFTSNTGIVNTAQVFTTTGLPFGFGHTGLDALILAANQNGRIFVSLVGGTDADVAFGIHTTNAQTGYAGMQLCFDRQNGTNELYRIMSGTFYDSLTTIANGNYLALYRVGPMWKAQVSPDAVTWSDIPGFLFALTYSSAAAAYIVCDMNAATAATITFPKITQYATGNLAQNFIQDGDSLAFGTTNPGPIVGNIGTQGYIALSATKDTFYKNVAVPGSDWVSRNTALATDVYPLFGQVGNSFNKIIISAYCGINQLHSFSPAITYASMLVYVNNVLNQDSRTRVMVYTLCNCDPAYVTDADRLTYNALILATTQTARLKFVDISTEPLLNNANAYLNATYYQADGVHLTQVGYNLLAGLGNAVLTTF